MTKSLQSRLFLISASCMLLASCTDDQLAAAFPILDPRFEHAPMNNESKESLRKYFNKPNPKAFAYSPEKGVNWHAWGSSDAKETALSMCESESGTDCELFAVNNKIVWEPDEPLGPGGNSLEGTLYITIASVNLRSGPGSRHASLLVVPKGEIIQSLAREGNWYLVTVDDGTVGYIYGEYLLKK